MQLIGTAIPIPSKIAQQVEGFHRSGRSRGLRPRPSSGRYSIKSNSICIGSWLIRAALQERLRRLLFVGFGYESADK